MRWKNFTIILGATLLILADLGSYALSGEAKRQDAIQAALDGDTVRLGQLLDAGVSANAAVRLESPRWQWVLRQTLDYSNRRDFETPLLLAAAWGRHADTVDLLLKRGADPNSAAGDGLTPLMFSISNKDPATSKLLIAKGANPYAIDKCNDPIWTRDPAMSSLLTEAKVDWKRKGFSCKPRRYHSAAYNAKRERMRRPLEPPPDSA